MAPASNGSSTPTSNTLSSRTFTLKALPPSSSTGSSRSNSSERASRRLYVSAEVLRAFRISAGDVLLLAGTLGSEELQKRLSLKENNKETEQNSPVSLCYAWPSFSLDRSNVAAGSSLLRDSDLEYGDIVSLSTLPLEHTHCAEKVVIKLLPVSEDGLAQPDRKGKRREHDTMEILEAICNEVLSDLKYIMLNQIIKFRTSEGTSRRGKVLKVYVDGKFVPNGVYAISEDTRIEFQTSTKSAQSASQARMPDNLIFGTIDLRTGYEGIGGLDRHIAQIRELVELPLTRPDLYAHFNLQPPRGILLHGPPGTGKTLLASSIALSLQLPYFSVDGSSLSSPYHGETEQRLREIFKEAEECAPSIIIIDEVDALVPAREDAGEVERRVVATLLTLMDGLASKGKDGANTREARVVVIAATNRPNAIDQALRRPGRFDREIEIGVPDADARLSILKVILRKTPHTLVDSLLEEIAGKTHGYVGADLASLVHTAGLTAIRRVTGGDAATKKMTSATTPISSSLAEEYLLPDDMFAALLSTRPSALRSVFLETPQISWSDIGGQSDVKQKLQEVIEWPLKHPQTFKRLGVQPPRGILLYGPSGCSKTLIARALASGAGVNFIAIKGPEVFNKYVGESERTIRETFRKARAAAPCIVFLDEIDVIAASRNAEEGDSSGSGRILTTLLTEMDGIEEMHGVTILAATNRPEIIDDALMRPGRLDRILYVAPPDHSARLEIFRVNFSKMAIAEGVDVNRLADMTEGCSGAEIVSICQDGAFNAMNEDLDALTIQMHHFVKAAENMRHRITPEMIAYYEAWRDSAGVRDV